ncbi:MAG: MBL fold metallo-hydrolase [Gemmataceae bacterium]|nr:MBL fold metallo-hydrolase [Gemmataceae bacterium]
MLFYQRFVPGLAIASYLVGDEKSGEAVVIDPTRDVGEFLQFARQHQLHIRHIVETHIHADFVCGSRELKAQLNGAATIHCSSYGGPDWTQPYADRHVKEGDGIDIGGLRLGFLHTPGHTPEHISISLTDTSRSADVPWFLFTGDFLFVGDVGRPDLLGEQAQQALAHQLYGSVFDKLPMLADFTEIFPAHGSGSLCGKALSSRLSSTVGYERRFNPSLVRKPESQWVHDLLAGMPLAPPYFRRMKQVNKEGPAILGSNFPGQQRYSAKQVRDQASERCLILDVRPKEAFAAAHIPNAINVPVGPSLPTWAGWVLPYDLPIIIVPEEPGQMSDVITSLLRVGLDDLRGYLEGGIDAWETAGYPLASLSTISVHDVQRELAAAPAGQTILDVRTEGEWHGGHVGGALHIHGGKLSEHFTEISRDRPVTVICGSGYRASIAASFLQREGYRNVRNVLGGMSAWKAAGLPISRT